MNCKRQVTDYVEVTIKFCHVKVYHTVTYVQSVIDIVAEFTKISILGLLLLFFDLRIIIIMQFLMRHVSVG